MKTLIVMYCVILLNSVSYSEEKLIFTQEHRSETLQRLVHEANVASKSSFHKETWKGYIEQIGDLKGVHLWGSGERRQLLYVLDLAPRQLWAQDDIISNNIIKAVDLKDTIEIRLLLKLIATDKIHGGDHPQIFMSILTNPYLSNHISSFFQYFWNHQEVVDAYLNHCIEQGISKWSDLDLENFRHITLNKALFAHVHAWALQLAGRPNVPPVVCKMLHVFMRSNMIDHFTESDVQLMLDSPNVHMANIAYGILLLDDRFKKMRTREAYMSIVAKHRPHTYRKRLFGPPYLTLGVLFLDQLSSEDLRVILRSSDSLMRACCALASWRRHYEIQKVCQELEVNEKELRTLLVIYGLDTIIMDNQWPISRKDRMVHNYADAYKYHVQMHDERMDPLERGKLLQLAIEELGFHKAEALLNAIEFNKIQVEVDENFKKRLLDLVGDGMFISSALGSALGIEVEQLIKQVRAHLMDNKGQILSERHLSLLLLHENKKVAKEVLEAVLDPAAMGGAFYRYVTAILINDGQALQIQKSDFEDQQFTGALAGSLSILFHHRSKFSQFKDLIRFPLVVKMWNEQDGLKNSLRLLAIHF